DASNLNIFIGKNDTGKSNILRALNIALSERYTKHTKCKEIDLNKNCSKNDTIEIKISFIDPHGISVRGRRINLKEDHLLNIDNELVIVKSFTTPLSDGEYYPETFIEVYDYPVYTYKKKNGGLTLNFCKLKDRDPEGYLKIINLGEKALQDLIDSLGIDYEKERKKLKRGRGKVPLEDLRKILREHLKSDKRFKKETIEVVPKRWIMKGIEEILPKFMLFSADEGLDVKKDSFQDRFKEVIVDSIRNSNEIKNIEETVRTSITSELDEIAHILQKQTDTIKNLSSNPTFAWGENIIFDVIAKDTLGIDTPISNRGSGIQRLLMLSYFMYLTKKEKNTIFAVEEPEIHLHPEQQRSVFDFLKIQSEQNQIFITTHSPTFIDKTNIERMYLVTKTKENGTNVKNLSKDKGYEIIDELGFKLSDVLQSDAVVFTEGPSDAFILKEFMTTCGHDSDKLNIVILHLGGRNAKHVVVDDLVKLNRNCIVILDSEKDNKDAKIDTWRLDLQTRCKGAGKECHILKKRSIENYFSTRAIAEVLQLQESSIGLNDFRHIKTVIQEAAQRESKLIDYNKAKVKYGKKIAKEMTKEEIHSDIRSIIDEIVNLTK
ncbi:MAG: AAA family ATPase, partial [Candidatus Altiarchaeota archaeon]|nr:AAA family ATPase [Candidatus Altiarchaeota archaeon]